MNKTLLVVTLGIIVICGSLFVIFGRTSHQDSVALVEGFPDIPVYPKAILVASDAQSVTDGIIYKSIWEVGSTVPNISDWYQRSLPESGWVIDVKPADSAAIDIQNIISVKAENTLNLGIISRGTGQQAQITAEFFPKTRDTEVEPLPIE
jgi:hypothetical protein